MPSFPKIFDFVENGVTNSDLFFLVGGIKQARSLTLNLSPLPPIRFLRRHLFFYFVLIARVKRVFGQVSPLPFALCSQSLFDIAQKAHLRQRAEVNSFAVASPFIGAKQAVGKKASGGYCAFVPEGRSLASASSPVMRHKASLGFDRCKFN